MYAVWPNAPLITSLEGVREKNVLLLSVTSSESKDICRPIYLCSLCLWVIQPTCKSKGLPASLLLQRSGRKFMYSRLVCYLQTALCLQETDSVIQPVKQFCVSTRGCCHRNGFFKTCYDQQHLYYGRKCHSMEFTHAIVKYFRTRLVM